MRMAIAALLLSNALSLLAQPATASEEPALTVATEGQRSIFQIGERIPIDLSFTGPANKQFEINNASHDGSGRMGLETFEVEPHIQLKQLAERAQSRPYVISANRNRIDENYEVAQYRATSLDLLSAKISQFPKGSTFVVNSAGSEPQEQKKLERSIKTILEKHGMILTASPN